MYGTEFEVKLRNKLTQKAIAKECVDWIRRKVTFKSNITSDNMMGFINLDDKNYMPINGFTTIDLGCERGNNAYNMVQKTETSFTKAYGSFFKKPNFIEDTVRTIEKRIGLSYTEDKLISGDVFDVYDLFCYIYAVLYSPRYRAEYRDFLNRDFPVIPYPNAIVFRELCALGHDLIETHLLKKNYADDSISFVGDEHRIDKIAYTDGKVVLNRAGYFFKVPTDVWEFIVGGYQPCHRWLRERKGRELSIEDIEHYRAMIGALEHTQLIMRQIDQVTEGLF